MATATYYTYLMYNTASSGSATMAKLVDITSFPDLGGDPEQIDITTLSDRMKKYLLGVQDTGVLKFESLYDPTEFTTLKGLENTSKQYGVYFCSSAPSGSAAPSGDLGQFTFTGQLSAYVAAGAVNEARKVSIAIAPSTEIGFNIPE